MISQRYFIIPWCLFIFLILDGNNKIDLCDRKIMEEDTVISDESFSETFWILTAWTKDMGQKSFLQPRRVQLFVVVTKDKISITKTIIRNGVPTPLFLRQPRLDPACPSFLKSLFPLPSIRQFPLPSRNPLLP